MRCTSTDASVWSDEARRGRHLPSLAKILYSLWATEVEFIDDDGKATAITTIST